MKLRVSKSYDNQVVLRDLELELREGEVVCILGESGGGKTTLLNILAGLIPFEGSLEDMPKKVGYIFQEPRLLPSLTITQNLQYAGGRDEDIEKILKKIGLFEHRNKRPKMLSGGEKQRVAIARAFLSDAPLLLLDEPFSSLDTGLKIRLAKVFAELWQEKRPTTVYVTHDLEEALMLGHRIVVLKSGKVVADFALSKTELPRPYGSEEKVKEQLLQLLTE